MKDEAAGIEDAGRIAAELVRAASGTSSVSWKRS
jgi:hypothetical protein